MSTDPQASKNSATVSKQRSTEHVIHSLVEQSLLPAFVMNKNKELLYCNGAFSECIERYWNITPTIGKKLDDFKSARDTTPFKMILSKAEEILNSGSSSRSTHQAPYNGKSLELNTSFTPIGDMVSVTFKLSSIDIDEQTQSLHNTILNNITESVICLNLLGEITYWNQGAENIFGHTKEEMLGGNIRKIAPDFDSDKVLSLLKEDRPYKSLWNYKKDDGTLITVDVSTDLLYDHSNKLTGIISNAIDVTQTQKLERLVQYTNKAAKIGGWEIDLVKNQPLWTEETYNIHDVEVGKSISLDEAFGYYHPETRPLLEVAFDKLMKEKVSFDLELKLITATKNVKWVRVTGDSEVNSAGNPIVLGTIQDINKRKKAEEKEKASDLLFKNTFDHAGLGMALVDISGVLIDANPYFVNLIGYPKAKLLKKSFAEFTHPDDIDKDLGLFEKTLKGELDYYEMPKRYLTVTGEVIWVQLNVSMYRSSKGEPLMAIAMVQDITEKVRAEDLLKELNSNLEFMVTERTKELSESNEELETFSYMMSHDLRTPLRSAMLFSDILDRKHLQDLEGKGRDVFTHLRSSLSEMDQLVNDLLEYAKMRNKELRKQNINTRELIDEVLSDVEKHYDTFENTKITLAKELAPISGDLTLLYHVLRNIISNCFKYKKEDTRLELTISAEHKSHSTTLVIEDNGTGFSPKFATEIFKPFERLVNRSDVHGTGLGLAIVQRVIEKHQGKVWAEGEVGVGAKFYIELPNE